MTRGAARWVAAVAVCVLGCMRASAEDSKALPIERARMLPAPSAAAVNSLAEVLEDFGFRIRVRHASDGLFITQSMGVGRLRKHGLTVSPIRDTAPLEVEVHAFVSRAVEPAHVHVDAIVITSPRADGTRSHGYSLGEVEKQVLDALEEKLGVSGHPIPDSLEERRTLASSLLPESERAPCALGAMQIPQVIPGSKVAPMFPAEPLRAGETGRVIVLARILGDGSTVPLRVLQGSATPHSSDLEEACKAVVGLWRYRPARSGSCPLDIPMTVAVDFKQ